MANVLVSLIGLVVKFCNDYIHDCDVVGGSDPSHSQNLFKSTPRALLRDIFAKEGRAPNPLPSFACNSNGIYIYIYIYIYIF